MNPTEARRKKALKTAVLVVAGVILQAAIILLFVFLVLRVRHVRLRVRSAEVEGLAVNYSSSSPSFSMAMHMQVNIRNPNFGHYKFEETNLTVSYRGRLVGEAVIEKAKVRAFSTKKVKLTVSVDSRALASRSSKIKMRKDIYAGMLTLEGKATLTGKVHLFEVFKKSKSAGMECTMEVNVKSKEVQNLKCH
ncbi:hypothetical protein SAY86_028753 [Trapa natans]|uniref:Late embryogenesis abundant protein LEA-2 subgroup domain-containing protein n=1 Tax=Trapa natans TaxID=22666 RepID=A0AAN7RB20_TRANT|nr:hypothetical protein SAY86_028753 [Trapa natans]